MAIYYAEDGLRKEATGEILDAIIAVNEAEAAKKSADKAEATKAATDKAALLAKLGITADEAKLLLS